MVLFDCAKNKGWTRTCHAEQWPTPTSMILIDLSSHRSQGLWSGPNFGICHASHSVWLLVTNGSKKF